VQETVLLGTEPLLVAGLNVQETVSTIVAAGCWTVIVASAKDKSVISSVQFTLEQPGASAIGLVGGVVVTVNDTEPFLIALAGITVWPPTVTGAGFCPGG
jgi:archaellum component FlaF (FlaF/FlaG flagellin family)